MCCVTTVVQHFGLWCRGGNGCQRLQHYSSSSPIPPLDVSSQKWHCAHWGAWKESFFQGRNARRDFKRPTFGSAHPPLLFSSITALLLQTLLLLLFCFQFLLVLNSRWCLCGQRVRVLFLFFFFILFFPQVPVLQLGFSFLAHFN